MIITPEDRESFISWLDFQPGTERLIDTARSTDKISTTIKYGSSHIERDIEMPQLAKLWSFQNGKLDPDEMMKPGQDLWSVDKFDKYHDPLRLAKDVTLKQISSDISKNYRTDNFPAYRTRWGDNIFKDVKPAFSDEIYQKLLSRKPSPYDKVMVDATLTARRNVSPEEIAKYIRTGEPGAKQSQVVMAASELSHLSKYKRLPDTNELKGKYIIEDIAKHKNLGNTSKTYYNQELDSAVRSWLGTSSNVSRPTAGYQLEKTAALFLPKGKDRAASFEFEMEGGSGVKTLNFLRNLKGKKRDLFNKYFELDTDGTLTGGGLEVKPSMVPRKDVKACVNLIQELTRKGGWSTGRNTSTHYHIDARDLIDLSNPNFGPKPNQMLSYLKRNDHLFETVVDSSRIGNKYAQRVKNLPHVGTAGHYSNIVSDSMFKWGTYENRILEGTSDPSKVLNWYDFNQSLVARNATSDLSKLPYYEKFSDMVKGTGTPKSTVDYYRDLERKMDPMSRNVIPVHPNCRCYWEKVRVLLAKILPGLGNKLHLMGNGLEIIRKAQAGLSEHFVFSEDHVYNTLRWYKREEYSSRKKIFNELLKVDPSKVPDKLLIQPDQDIGIKVPEKRAMSLIAQAMKDSDHAPTVALQGEFRRKLDDDMRRYQIKAAKRIQSSLTDLKNEKIDRIEARRQFDSARLSMKHTGVQAIKTRTQQLTQSSVVESAMEEGVEVLIFRTRPYKACRVCKALDGKHFRVEDVKPLEPNIQNALGVPDKDQFKPKPARMSVRKSHRRVILMRNGTKIIRH